MNTSADIKHTREIRTPSLVLLMTAHKRYRQGSSKFNVDVVARLDYFSEELGMVLLGKTNDSYFIPRPKEFGQTTADLMRRTARRLTKNSRSSFKQREQETFELRYCTKETFTANPWAEDPVLKERVITTRYPKEPGNPAKEIISYMEILTEKIQ